MGRRVEDRPGGVRPNNEEILNGLCEAFSLHLSEKWGRLLSRSKRVSASGIWGGGGGGAASWGNLGNIPTTAMDVVGLTNLLAMYASITY